MGNRGSDKRGGFQCSSLVACYCADRIVTVDAVGAQIKIAQAIRDEKADRVLRI